MLNPHPHSVPTFEHSSAHLVILAAVVVAQIVPWTNVPNVYYRSNGTTGEQALLDDVARARRYFKSG